MEKYPPPDDETLHARSLPCRAHFGVAEIVHKARSLLRETPCSPLVPPLREQLANPLSQQAGKCLVIPKGEGYSSSLREFHVKPNIFSPDADARLCL